MNVDYGIPTLVIIAITIGVFIIIAINKNQNAHHLSPEEKIAHQVETVDLFIKRNPQVRGSFVAAERDGATHIKILDGVRVAFYRINNGIYEKRILAVPERPEVGRFSWVANWQKCRKMPSNVISISEVRRLVPFF